MRSKRRPAREAVKILIAEDSPTQAEQLRQLLEENDYKVTVAENGKKALAAARTQKPDLVISDIVMPEMDGYTLCKKINSRKELGDVPVILLTSLSAPQDVLMGLQCGAASFIRKPYDGQYLLSRIEYMITNKGLRKSQKTQMVLEIYLGGQKHSITSEKQQILDMLIATSEETVLLNEDLKTREKQLTRSYQSLNALYHISEGLNQGTSEKEVAEKSLERAMELPDVHAGWFLIREGKADFRVAAAQGLPPGLNKPGALDGDCVCRHKLLGGELSHATNILECERLKNTEGGTNGLRYHASVPIWIGNQVLGIINLVGREKGMLSEDDLKVLHGVGNQVGVALERTRLVEHLEKMVEERTVALRAEIAVRKKAEEETRRNLERIRALHEIDVAISSTLDLRTVLNILLEKIELFVPIAAASTVRLFNKENGFLEPVACRNLNEAVWKEGEGKTGRGLANSVLETKAPLIVRNVQADPRTHDPEFYRKHALISYLGIPLMAKGHVLGVLGFYTREEHEFSKEEIDFLMTLGGQAAIAIQNAQLYEQTKKQAEELERSNKVKDEFLSVMSHELRTPLNVVMGYTGLVVDGMLGEINPRQKEALEKVIIRANDQLAMINSVLYTTALEANEVKKEIHEFSLRDFLAHMRAEHPAPEGKEITLSWDYAPDLPVVRTDGSKLKLILQNLVDNAIKFTKKGSVTISATIRQEATGERRQSEILTPSASGLTPTDASPLPPHAFVELQVADRGIGIPQEMQSIIFEKFQQVDSSATRLYGGVGLGLYIVKQFTEMLGGTIKVESEPGKGSTFTVKIPVE